MHRFFFEGNLKPNNYYSLSPEEAHHAFRVLRLSVGDGIEVLDGKALYSAEIVEISKNQVKVFCQEPKESIEPRTKITLYQGFPKAEKFFHIVQKCTEIGVHNIIPVLMERSVKKGNNAEKILEKSNKLAIEACKQCGRGKVPHIAALANLEKHEKQLLSHNLLLVPWEEEQMQSLQDSLMQARIGMDIGIVIGPEGGINSSEIQFLRNLNAQTITFGKRILRTETAGMCAIFAILSRLNDL